MNMHPQYPNLMLQPPPTEVQLDAMTSDELVNRLWDKRIRNRIIRTLVGGLTSTEMKGVRVSHEVREAIVRGLSHWSPKVRWWSLQLIDHVTDAKSLESVVPLLDDPVQRVRTQARHTLICEGCKESPEISAAGRRLIEDYEAGRDRHP
jgi:hypothetical protein